MRLFGIGIQLRLYPIFTKIVHQSIFDYSRSRSIHFFSKRICLLHKGIHYVNSPVTALGHAQIVHYIPLYWNIRRICLTVNLNMI